MNWKTAVQHLANAIAVALLSSMGWQQLAVNPTEKISTVEKESLVNTIQLISKELYECKEKLP